MLFRSGKVNPAEGSGKVNPAEGYPRPPEFNGRAIATGTELDWTHAIYMHERMQMLEDVIQHVLLEHEVSTDQVLRAVLHSAIGQSVRVRSVPTGNAFKLVGLEELNGVEDQSIMRENLFVPRCLCRRGGRAEHRLARPKRRRRGVARRRRGWEGEMQVHSLPLLSRNESPRTEPSHLRQRQDSGLRFLQILSLY
jgi:hypothetical protein